MLYFSHCFLMPAIKARHKCLHHVFYLTLMSSLYPMVKGYFMSHQNIEPPRFQVVNVFTSPFLFLFDLSKNASSLTEIWHERNPATSLITWLTEDMLDTDLITVFISNISHHATKRVIKLLYGVSWHRLYIFHDNTCYPNIHISRSMIYFYRLKFHKKVNWLV